MIAALGVLAGIGLCMWWAYAFRDARAARLTAELTAEKAGRVRAERALDKKLAKR